MIRVVAPMAGITNANFLNKVIPLGFDVATLGGYSLDAPAIEASKKIIARGRAEFDFPLDEIFTHIQNEVNSIKSVHSGVKVSALETSRIWISWKSIVIADRKKFWQSVVVKKC